MEGEGKERAGDGSNFPLSQIVLMAVFFEGYDCYLLFGGLQFSAQGTSEPLLASLSPLGLLVAQH